MKTKLLLTVAALAAAVGLTHASATKNNVGTQLPELNLTYLGTAPELKGKPLIVEFWATWCPPCRTSIPHLNELYKKFHKKGLEAVGVTKEDEAVVKAFQKDLPMDYPVGLDKTGKLSTSFGVRGIPHAMLVDKSGKIVWEGHPMTLTEKQLEDLVK
jgi:cytochrome c biogenesis protein CcmG/thiol:disulfide interchange protein DsbE